jgi:hypothetical protein
MRAAVAALAGGSYNSASTSLAPLATNRWCCGPMTRLAAARNRYLEAGFRLTNEEPHHSLGVDLVGQSYQLDLTDLPSPSPPGR